MTVDFRRTTVVLLDVFRTAVYCSLLCRLVADVRDLAFSLRLHGRLATLDAGCDDVRLADRQRYLRADATIADAAAGDVRPPLVTNPAVALNSLPGNAAVYLRHSEEEAAH